jgi:hypothetical protein
MRVIDVHKNQKENFRVSELCSVRLYRKCVRRYSSMLLITLSVTCNRQKLTDRIIVFQSYIAFRIRLTVGCLVWFDHTVRRKNPCGNDILHM